MQRTTVLTIAAVALLLLAGGAWYVLGAGGAEPEVDVEAVAGPDADSATPTAGADASAPESDGSAPATPADDATAGGEPADGARTYGVDQASSSVSYTIDETLRGEPVTVVGTTSEVATTVTLDPADPSTLTFGEVAVNARTFSTDSSLRDNAVRGRILGTDDPANELVTFTPTSVGDLPDDLGGGFDLEVTGDLAVAGTTAEQTFPLTVTPEGEGFRLVGATTVSRETYGLVIPSVPFVADVPDDVGLELDLLLLPG